MSAYIESVDDSFEYANDWLELIDSASSPCSSNLSNDAQEATLVGLVPWNKQRSAARFFLGFAYTDTSTARLVREVPEQHPTFPWLYADSISFTPYLIRSNADNVDGEPKVTSVFYPNLKTGYYEYAVATVRYRSFRCRFLDDSYIATAQDEWQRYTYFETESKFEALQVTGGLSQLTFAEGTGASGQPLAGTTKFGAPMAMLLSKTGFTLYWLQVPFDYVSESTSYFYPTKILNCVGTVNSSTFLGNFDAGTVLMNPPRFVEKRFPVADDNPVEPLRSVDIAIPFEFFDPPRGGGAPTVRGHNLMPFAGDGEKVGDGKFYLATRDGTAGGTQLLRSTDHRTIFEYVHA